MNEGLGLASLLPAAAAGVVPKLNAGLLLLEAPAAPVEAFPVLGLLLRKPMTGEKLLPKGAAADADAASAGALPAAAALLSVPGVLLLVVNCSAELGEAPELVLPKLSVTAGVEAGLNNSPACGVSCIPWAGAGVISKPSGGAGVLPACKVRLGGVRPPAAAARVPLPAWMLEDRGFPKVTCPLDGGA